jgi:hypothetical protein
MASVHQAVSSFHVSAAHHLRWNSQTLSTIQHFYGSKCIGPYLTTLGLFASRITGLRVSLLYQFWAALGISHPTSPSILQTINARVDSKSSVRAYLGIVQKENVFDKFETRVIMLFVVITLAKQE